MCTCLLATLSSRRANDPICHFDRVMTVIAALSVGARSLLPSCGAVTVGDNNCGYCGRLLPSQESTTITTTIENCGAVSKSANDKGSLLTLAAAFAAVAS